jgi:arsenical pump membrane protein
MTAAALICAIAAASVSGVVIRPWRLPEAIWAVSGAVALVAAGLLPWRDAWHGVARGGDVYLFLAGMMTLAELARQHGLFDYLAARAAAMARGSPTRLFGSVYLVGTLVTIVLSNDATAVVLTPAVAALVRTVKAKDPLPYLYICAFIANAASFVLPVSNPANLVIYGGHMPALAQWLRWFALPSALAILSTYAVLRVTQRAALRGTIDSSVAAPAMTAAGWVAAAGIVATALALMAASALGWQLGLPSALAGLATAIAVLATARATPRPLLRGISWGVLPLVAGLFVLVQALDHAGLLARLAGLLGRAAALSGTGTAWGSGIILAVACNLMNNLPAGLIAGSAAQAAHAPPGIAAALLIGIDLGPNLSVTGSLATILWLAALRREGLTVGAGAFLKLGLLVMPPALLLALAALTASRGPGY